MSFNKPLRSCPFFKPTRVTVVGCGGLGTLDGWLCSFDLFLLGSVWWFNPCLSFFLFIEKIFSLKRVKTFCAVGKPMTGLASLLSDFASVRLTSNCHKPFIPSPASISLSRLPSQTSKNQSKLTKVLVFSRLGPMAQWIFRKVSRLRKNSHQFNASKFKTTCNQRPLPVASGLRVKTEEEGADCWNLGRSEKPSKPPNHRISLEVICPKREV